MSRPIALRLLALEGWARSHYLPEEWGAQSFLTTLEEHAMSVWAIDSRQAKNRAEVIQPQLIHSLSPASSEAVAP